MVIWVVSLRMAASAEAPSSPTLLHPRLRARGRVGNGERVGVSTGADRRRTVGRFELRVAYSRDCSVEPLRPLARAAAPLGPMRLPKRLRVRGGAEMVREQQCQGALTRKQTRRGGGAHEGDDLRLFEDSSERRGTLVFDKVVFDTASEGGW